VAGVALTDRSLARPALAVQLVGVGQRSGGQAEGWLAQRGAPPLAGGSVEPMAAPNLLIFMTDQQRGATVLPGSTVKAITPRLDHFRDEGVTFTSAFCPSPHCCPSRATFHSGLYPSEHGVWNNVDVGNTLSRGLNDGVRLWSEDLAAAGYRMTFSGKWHISAEEGPADRGWETTAPMPPRYPRVAGTRRPAPDPYEWRLYLDGQRAAVPDVRADAQILRQGYGTYTHYGQHEDPFRDGRVVAQAIDALRARPRDGQPWCQYIGVLGPHDPYFVPPRFLDLYDLDAVRLPANFGDRMLDKPALYRRTRGRFDQLDEREHREAIRHYLAFCTYLDTLFGQVLDALDETGQAENTLVLYCSDHGDYLAEHGLWCKGLPCFEPAYHIPFITRWPAGAAQPGRSVEAFVGLEDIAPTVLELTGVMADRAFAGRSLVPFLRGEPPGDWRDAVYTQSNGNELYGIQRSVRTRDWCYVYNGFDDDELYDLRLDPGQTTNRAADPDLRPVLRDLSQRLWRFAYERRDVCINPYIMVGLAPFGPGIAFAD
jgi:arylsulfatase A-like enzyme